MQPRKNYALKQGTLPIDSRASHVNDKSDLFLDLTIRPLLFFYNAGKLCEFGMWTNKFNHFFPSVHSVCATCLNHAIQFALSFVTSVIER